MQRLRRRSVSQDSLGGLKRVEQFCADLLASSAGFVTEPAPLRVRVGAAFFLAGPARLDTSPHERLDDLDPPPIAGTGQHPAGCRADVTATRAPGNTLPHLSWHLGQASISACGARLRAFKARVNTLSQYLAIDRKAVWRCADHFGHMDH
jgi:hypothetical protein